MVLRPRTCPSGVGLPRLRLHRRPSLALAPIANGTLALSLTLGLLGLCAWPRAARAYTCSRVSTNAGPSLVWNTRTIKWYAGSSLLGVVRDADRAATLVEVQRSFAAWEDIDCSDITLPYQGERNGIVAEYVDDGENRNVVVAVASGWRYDAGAIAVTTSAYDPRTGVVVDADIEVNAQHFTFVKADGTCRSDSGYMDLRNTLTHEVGHILGLDHPPNTRANQEVTMFASAPPCETKKQTLAEDDIRGLCAIYPAGAPTVPCFPAASSAFVVADKDDGFGGCRAARGAGSMPWMLPIAVALFLARARRTRRARQSARLRS